MSQQGKLKWKMIKQILKSDDCILISLRKDNKFDFHFAGANYMVCKLFNRLKQFVPNWKAQWKENVS